MPTAAQSRQARRIKELEKALDDMRRAAHRLAAALPPRPSDQDLFMVEHFLDRLPRMTADISEAAAALRRTRPGDGCKTMLTRARGAIGGMERVGEALEKLLARTSVPLLPEPEMTPERRRVEMLSSAFVAMENAINGEDQHPDMKDFGYKFIPFGAMSFVEHMQAVWRILAVLDRTDEARFIDIGSGAGTKLFLAAEFFRVVHGLELDQNYVARRANIANDGLDEEGQGLRGVMQGDAFEFDRYHEYDIIYSYCPPIKDDLQNKLEQKIYESAADGTVIVAPFVRYSFMQAQPKAVRGILVKGYDGSALADLVREAELIGACVPPPPIRMTIAARKSPLHPVAVVLNRAGFAVEI